MKLPFDEKIENGIYIRKFYENTDSNEFKWHRDAEDRIITCDEKTDWLFQRDNELPIPFDDKILINKEIYHRLIKGTGDLTLKIKKLV